MITLTTHIGHYGKQVDAFCGPEKARAAVFSMAQGFGYDMPFGSTEGRFERRGKVLGSWKIEMA